MKLLPLTHRHGNRGQRTITVVWTSSDLRQKRKKDKVLLSFRWRATCSSGWGGAGYENRVPSDPQSGAPGLSEVSTRRKMK